MDNDIDHLNTITREIIICSIEVHRTLGPGLLESIYENALCFELRENRMIVEKQIVVPITYKSHPLGEYRLDMLVEREIIVELKSVEKIDPVHEAQLLTYLKITEKRLGLLINFNVPILKNGIKRIIL